MREAARFAFWHASRSQRAAKTQDAADGGSLRCLGLHRRSRSWNLESGPPIRGPMRAAACSLHLSHYAMPRGFRRDRGRASCIVRFAGFVGLSWSASRSTAGYLGTYLRCVDLAIRRQMAFRILPGAVPGSCPVHDGMDEGTSSGVVCAVEYLHGSRGSSRFASGALRARRMRGEWDDAFTVDVMQVPSSQGPRLGMSTTSSSEDRGSHTASG